ncbi:MAG: hypothetical protein H6739_05045 [Alphaproteobacteria bacterium]|nr:hypothetical protein [Alphaproteobacteria bacterium]
MRALIVTALLAGCTDYEIYVHDGTDVFYQNPVSEVDILLVVDDSCSMQPYQQQLSQNFSEFISFFIDAQVDYHIGVTTTDVMSDGAGHIIGEIITPETADGSGVFADNVNVGVEGSGSEMGLEAARLALSEPRISSTNAGFLRDTASLSVVFVSDEEDSSPWPVNRYINTFMDIKGARERDIFNASSLVVLDPQTCAPAAQAGSTRGDRYLDVTTHTGGVSGDICADTFADMITELSLNASRLRDTFFLSSEPAPATIEVSVDEALIPCDAGEWTFTRVDDNGTDRPAVVFERVFMPAPSSQIAIRYDYGSGDPTGFCEGGSAGDDTGGAR